MYRLQASKPFYQGFQQLTDQEQQALEKVIQQLAKSPRHSSLKAKKIKGAPNGVWEARARMNIRFTFHFQDPDILVLRTCGHHPTTLKHP